jgi:hypothetical protein
MTTATATIVMTVKDRKELLNNPKKMEALAIAVQQLGKAGIKRIIHKTTT